MKMPIATKLPSLPAVGILFVLLLAASGCAGSTVTPVPPTATPASEPGARIAQFAAACKGTPVPGSARYAGSDHPVYVVTGGDVQRAEGDPQKFDTDALKLAWLQGEWDQPIQLILCAEPVTRMFVESCGQYANGQGQSYEARRYRYVTQVTLIEAATGETLKTDRLTGIEPPGCTATIQSYDLVGTKPDVSEYALEASTEVIETLAPTE